MADQSPPPPPPTTKPRRNNCEKSTNPIRKTLTTASNLANLLPTSTVLAFQALMPSFTNGGTTCLHANRYLTASLIGVSAFICFMSSFTDSLIDPLDGKLYYGVATFKGLYIFNFGAVCDQNQETEATEKDDDGLKSYKISGIDIVHAFVSLVVFLVFAISDTDVQSCLFPESGVNFKVLLKRLPLGVGISASFLFTVFPTTRRGIGYADFPLQGK